MQNVKPIEQYLVDELGDIRLKIKELKKTEKNITDRIKSSGHNLLVGNTYMMVIRESERSTLDTKAVKLELGESWYKQHCKISNIKNVITTKVK
jgi:predicted phage-related endonuclease